MYFYSDYFHISWKLDFCMDLGMNKSINQSIGKHVQESLHTNPSRPVMWILTSLITGLISAGSSVLVALYINEEEYEMKKSMPCRQAI
jgi:hypothetical protein